MLFADTMAFPVAQPDILRAFKENCPFPLVNTDILPDLCVVTSAPPMLPTHEQTLDAHIAFMHLLHQATRQDITVVYDGKDVENYDGSAPLVIYGLQHCPTDFNVQELYDCNVRTMGVAYDVETKLGSGFTNPEGELKTSGVQFLEEAAASGMIVDLAHAGHRTARDVLNYIAQRNLDVSVMASHTGCFEVYNHPRNLPDDVLAGIADLGGVIGIVSITFFLDGEDDSMKAISPHLNHAINVAGIDHVCFGTDGIYTDTKEEVARAHYEKLSAALSADEKGFRPRFPDRPLPLIERGTKHAELLETLVVSNGYAKYNRPKIAYQNAFDFFARAL